MSSRKVAIVTGSGTGVGAATAFQLAQNGWNVVINYSKSEEEAHATQLHCTGVGAETLLIRADVADDAQCRAMTDAAIARWGRIDALVNNAGATLFGEEAKWDALDSTTFQRIFAVNSIGPFQMVRACSPHLKRARGSIVNVSSIAGALGIGSSIPYIAAKGAINAMTLHLAQALAPEVRVNAVVPGMISSRWLKEGLGEEGYSRLRAHYERSTPLGIPCSAEDVAEAIVWLTERARTITGELLLLDSGIHLGATNVANPQSAATD